MLTAGPVLLCAIAWAQTKSGSMTDLGSNKLLKSSDVSFAINAVQGGLAEVELGKLAVEKANSPDVRAFGQKMVDDHTKANGQLTAIAQKEEITFPATLNAEDQQLYNKLQHMSGAMFDKAYMKAMVKDHKQDVKEFKKEAKKGKDPQIKSFASETLPVLESHLEMAKSTESKVKAGS
jgi:putative membrane protein